MRISATNVNDRSSAIRELVNLNEKLHNGYFNPKQKKVEKNHISILTKIKTLLF